MQNGVFLIKLALHPVEHVVKEEDEALYKVTLICSWI